MPIIFPLFFTAIFAESPNSPLPVAFSIIPFTAPLAMVMRSAISEVPFWQVALSISLTFGLAVGCIWLAGRVFRVGTLLRGTPPKLRELPQLILRG